MPLVDHHIKSTEDFIGRAVCHQRGSAGPSEAESMKRAEVERLVVAEELLQRLRVQVPEVPQIPRSVTDLEQLVRSEMVWWINWRTKDPRDCGDIVFPASSQDGVLTFHGFQHGLLKHVPPLRGVSCGSERFQTLGLSKHEAPADWQNHHRTQHRKGQEWMWQSPKAAPASASVAVVLEQRFRPRRTSDPGWEV